MTQLESLDLKFRNRRRLGFFDCECETGSAGLFPTRVNTGLSLREPEQREAREEGGWRRRKRMRMEFVDENSARVSLNRLALCLLTATPSHLRKRLPNAKVKQARDSDYKPHRRVT